MNKIENDIEKGRRIAERLKRELEIAQSSWAQFEAINGKTELTRRDFRQAKEWLRLNVSNHGLLAATVRDTILALCRILDDGKRQDDCNLPQISRLLDHKNLRYALVEQAREHMPRFENGVGVYFENAEAQAIERKIALINDYVPKQWKPENRLKKWMIHKIQQEVLLPLRTKMLAHAGNIGFINEPTVNQIRYAVGRIGALISATHHIFVGSPLDEGSLKIRTKEANEFWDYAQVGFIEAFERDQRNIKSFTG